MTRTHRQTCAISVDTKGRCVLSMMLMLMLMLMLMCCYCRRRP